MSIETTTRNGGSAAGQAGGTTPGTPPSTKTAPGAAASMSRPEQATFGDRDRVAGAMRTGGHVVLAVVAVCGAALSYASLYEAAAPVFASLAYGFPILVDALILGASLQYVAGARTGRGRAGWRLTAHTGIAATIALNALAAFKPTGGGIAGVPWHVTAPAVWAVLVELYARQFAGDYRATHTVVQAIPVRLWLTAPIESARTWIRAARLAAYAEARTDVGVHAAATEALRQAVTGRDARRVRRVLRRQLRAGSLPPAAVLTACGWTTPGTGTAIRRSAQDVLRAALALVLADPTTTASIEARTIGSAPSINAVTVDSIHTTGSSRGDRSSIEDRVPGSVRGTRALASREARERVGRRSTRSTSTPAMGARSMDRLRAAAREGIQAGALPERPSAEAIRRYLGIAPARARILRDELTTDAVEIETPDTAPTPDPFPAGSAAIDLSADAAVGPGPRVRIDLDPAPVPLT